MADSKQDLRIIETLLARSDRISSLDRHFSRLMKRLAGQAPEELTLAAALVSSQTREGHVCLELKQLDNAEFLEEKFGEAPPSLPGPEHVATVLRSSPVVGKPEDFAPMILDKDNRLYLNRYWQYQNELAGFITGRIVETEPPKNLTQLSQRIDSYFEDSGKNLDWQKVAAVTALLKRFCVITGGPGTGKTFTVGKIIALLIETAGGRELNIKLVAPTGKAAIRLQDSIKKVKKTLPCPEEIKQRIPEEASTIHRLLGTIRHSPYFRHHRDKPLDVDVIVVDEASMVDMALMSKLVQALPEEARLILLGDNNQLASVEAGAVLADICDTGATHAYSGTFWDSLETVLGKQSTIPRQEKAGMQDCIVTLKRSYRFESQKGIGMASEAVNQGEGAEALSILHDPEFEDVTWHDPGKENFGSVLQEVFETYNPAEPVTTLFDKLEKNRILCAVRRGPQGVEQTNSFIEQFLKKKMGIKTNQTWYIGRPILISENDYTLDLFNGDVGIISVDSRNPDEVSAHFLTAIEPKEYRPFRLPEHETAFAMTVHKSQGSEFEHVILILPEKDSPILTRELIYTGLTRATRKVDVWGTEEAFLTAVSRRIRRHSGLRDALWAAE